MNDSSLSRENSDRNPRPNIPFGARSTADDVLAGLNLKGRTILVTGCNSGIGFETLRALTAHDAHVIGLARSIDAAREACALSGGKATPVACDLGDFASIAAAVDTVRRAAYPLDAIVTNAGIMCPKVLEVRYGVESQFFVNHIGHFLLVNRLVDMVPDRTDRIVIVSSSASIEQAPKEGSFSITSTATASTSRSLSTDNRSSPTRCSPKSFRAGSPDGASRSIPCTLAPLAARVFSGASGFLSRSSFRSRGGS